MRSLVIASLGKFIMFSLATTITGCAGIPPAHLVNAKNTVDGRYIYQHRVTNVDYELARKEDGTANCTKFAIEYQKLVNGVMFVCKLPDGTKHRVVDKHGWRLDNREKTVIPVELSDCR
jgi:hypothetical protein